MPDAVGLAGRDELPVLIFDEKVPVVFRFRFAMIEIAAGVCVHGPSVVFPDV